MLPIIEDPNTQKQLRRSEQIKKWNEREMLSNLSNTNSNHAMDDEDVNMKVADDADKYTDVYNRTSKVRFPKGCVFLAACSSGDTEEVRSHLKMGVNINTSNIDGLTALHQVINFDYIRIYRKKMNLVLIVVKYIQKIRKCSDFYLFLKIKLLFKIKIETFK